MVKILMGIIGKKDQLHLEVLKKRENGLKPNVILNLQKGHVEQKLKFSIDANKMKVKQL